MRIRILSIKCAFRVDAIDLIQPESNAHSIRKGALVWTRLYANLSFSQTWSDTNDLFIHRGSSLAQLTIILPPHFGRWHVYRDSNFLNPNPNINTEPCSPHCCIWVPLPILLILTSSVRMSTFKAMQDYYRSSKIH